MLNMNRATLVGHAGRDPEIRALNNGGKAAVFTLATTEKWKDREGAAAGKHRMAPDRGLRAGRRGGREDAAQGRRGAGRGPDRHARLPRQGRQTTAPSPEIVVAGWQGTVNILSGRRASPDSGSGAGTGPGPSAPALEPGGQADATREAEEDGNAPESAA